MLMGVRNKASLTWSSIASSGGWGSSSLRLASPNATCWKPALSAEVYSWEAFEWAMSMLFSRAINLREVGQLALVPYADLLNHSPYAFSYFYYQSIPLSNEREVTLYADRSYAKNDQVLISYGQKSNAELLLLYGFVVDRNLFDEVELAPPLPLTLTLTLPLPPTMPLPPTPTPTPTPAPAPAPTPTPKPVQAAHLRVGELGLHQAAAGPGHGAQGPGPAHQERRGRQGGEGEGPPRPQRAAEAAHVDARRRRGVGAPSTVVATRLQSVTSALYSQAILKTPWAAGGGVKRLTIRNNIT